MGNQEVEEGAVDGPGVDRGDTIPRVSFQGGLTDASELDSKYVKHVLIINKIA